MNKKGRKTIVLDLDETLIHSQFEPLDNPDYTITLDISNDPNQEINRKVFVCKRPYCDQFLESIASQFEVVIFTASL